ncbi:hypothetical protein LTR62_001042 [Meristemomyces frigidus]|uniref:Dipeptidyl-peptidase V n=1 Tax=Meristemomyces frigidus TaxID=1508187 RepID=A0AAN7T9F6_9PEZI|nr:hypothetical protein LTR62_001042 [Meristemomyces frigidus]
MVIKTTKFTPEQLLSAPRRSAAVPNPTGTKLLFTETSYDLATHKKDISLYLHDVVTGEESTVARNEEGRVYSSFSWTGEWEFVCLRSEEDGTTGLWVCVLKAGPRWGGGEFGPAGRIEAAVGEMKICRLLARNAGPGSGSGPGSDEFGVVVSAPAGPDGELWTPAKAKRKMHSTGRLYEGLFVRHWDHWVGKERNSLWFGKMVRGRESGKLELAGGLSNALLGSGLESPIPPFGGGDHFDVNAGGVMFVAKAPGLNPALNTKCNVYLLHLDSWTQGTQPRIEEIPIPDFHGAASSPVWNPDGNGGAFLMMRAPGYEADHNAVFVVRDMNASSRKPSVQRLDSSTTTLSKETFWSRSPGAIVWSADGKSLLAMAEDEGFGKLFEIEIETQRTRVLTETGYVADMRPLADGRTFVSGSSLVENSWFKIVDTRLKSASSPMEMEVWSDFHLASQGGKGLNASQVSTIWTPASNPKINEKVHSLVMKPSTFKPDRKYPVAYLIHGGPQGSWADSWSTRWNPAVFAEQGYIVVAPNPTGSTGYGQDFTDAIRGNWGGDPYQDIVNCFEWVGKNMPEADNERAVALGASYGGYMMNWIQGHDLGRKFKALVCHDGITTFAGGLLATEELYFPFHDLGGTPWYDPEFSTAATKQTTRNFGSSTLSDWKKWDPSEHFDQWSTPELVIHSELDYRLTVSEGLTAFNVLQARGVESQFLTFPDENHWVLKPENSLVWHKVVLNWINKYVGLPPYTKEDPNDEEFWGGRRDKNEVLATLPAAGKPET